MFQQVYFVKNPSNRSRVASFFTAPGSGSPSPTGAILTVLDVKIQIKFEAFTFTILKISSFVIDLDSYSHTMYHSVLKNCGKFFGKKKKFVYIIKSVLYCFAVETFNFTRKIAKAKNDTFFLFSKHCVVHCSTIYHGEVIKLNEA